MRVRVKIVNGNERKVKGEINWALQRKIHFHQ